MDLSEYINLYNISTGRRLFAFKQVHEAATKRGGAEIAQLAKQGMEHDTQTVALEARYAQSKATPQPETNEPKRSRAVDRMLDSTLSALHGGAEAYLHTHDSASEEYGAAQAFIREAFPQGPGAITRLPYEGELAQVDHLAGLFENKLASHIKALSLEKHAQRLEQLRKEYRVELEKPAPDVVTFDQVRAARAAGQQLLVRLTAKVLGAHGGDSDEDVAARRDLFGPIEQQNRKVGVYLRLRRPVLDVDPDSGEETDRDGGGGANV